MQTEASEVSAKVKSASFQINTRTAKALLQPIFKTINRNTVLPILMDVLIERKNGNLYFTTTDLESTTTVSVPDDNPKEFMCVFPGIELRYLIQNSMEQFINIEVGGNEFRDYTVRNGGFKLEIRGSRVDDYPKIPDFIAEKSVTIDTKEFLPYLEKAILFASDDDLRPAMTGIVLYDWKGFINIVSTDDHMLYWYPVFKTPKAFKDCKIIISKKTATLLLLAFVSEKEITIESDNYNLLFSCDNKKILTRPIDARYPDFTRVIPTENNLHFELNRSELASVLRMCDRFTNKSTHQIGITVYDSKIDIDGGDKDFGVYFNYSMKIRPNIDTFSWFRFGMDARFLLQAIGCSKGENVVIESSMKHNNAIIVDDCVLVMPLMMNQ